MAEQERKPEQTSAQTNAQQVQSLFETLVANREYKSAIDVQQQRLDTAKLEFAKLRDVTADKNGQLVYRSLAGLEKIGQFYAASGQLPDHLTNKPNACAVLYQLAVRLGVDPLSLMQKSYVVHGKPGVEAPFLIGMVNSSGKIKGRIQWDEKKDANGDVVSCTAWCIEAETGNRLEGTEITWDLVCKWGWEKPNKSGESMWVKMRNQMMRYRSSAWMIRAYFSDVTLGLYTKDELQEIDDGSNVATAAPSSLLSAPVAPPAPIQTAPPVATETKTVEREPERATETQAVSAQDLLEKTIRRGQEEATSKPDSPVVAPVQREETAESTSDAERLPADAMRVVFASIEKIATLAGLRVKRQKYAEDGSLHPDDLQAILDKCDARITSMDKKTAGNGAKQTNLPIS